MGNGAKAILTGAALAGAAVGLALGDDKQVADCLDAANETSKPNTVERIPTNKYTSDTGKDKKK